MEALGSYILSVTAAAILLGILQTIAGKKGGSAALLRLVGGLFLTFTVIAPVAEVDLDGLFDAPFAFSQQGSAIAASGQEISRSEMERIITGRCQAYILDKAESLHTQLEVEVTLSQEQIPVPTTVQLKGSVSPYAKSSLQQWLEEELGIPRERQVWIG